MSLFNLGLQCVGFMRENMDADYEKLENVITLVTYEQLERRIQSLGQRHWIVFLR